MTDFFLKNLDIVFFIYGLAFFTMGLAILIQPRTKSNFKIDQIIWLLAGFGITHGLNEWLDMLTILRHNLQMGPQVRAMVLLLSFVFLFEFGRRLICLTCQNYFSKWLALFLSMLSTVFIFGVKSDPTIWPRYFLGLPGGALSALGFFFYYRSNRMVSTIFKIRDFLLIATGVMAAYAVLGGAITPKADFFPASWLNNPNFLKMVGIPVQVFRAVCAVFLAWAIWNLLDIFNWELKNLQEKLATAEKLAAMGKIAGLIGHEFRNQLGAMRLAVYLLKNSAFGQTEDKVKKHLAGLEQRIIETDLIIENILNFARTGKLQFKNVNIHNILLKAIENVQNPAGIEIITQVEKNLPEIKGDEVQLERVFINIIVNAFQAMKGKGRLIITLGKKDNYLKAQFHDNGCGIAKDDQEKIFDLFFSTKSRGVGLGLAMSKMMIEAHGGDIGIKSEVNTGTTVSIKLPAE